MRHRPSFDPSAVLVARKSFTCSGAAFAPGQVFDADVSERRRRQMYEARLLAMKGSVEAREAEDKHTRDNAPGLLASIGIGA